MEIPIKTLGDWQDVTALTLKRNSWRARLKKPTNQTKFFMPYTDHMQIICNLPDNAVIYFENTERIIGKGKPTKKNTGMILEFNETVPRRFRVRFNVS